MTRERRIILAFNEILALRWQCNKCQTSIGFKLDAVIRLPQQCPGCAADFGEHKYTEWGKSIDAFVSTLKTLQPSQARFPATISFELLDDAEKGGA